MKIKIVKTDWYSDEITGTVVCKLRVRYDYENDSIRIKDLWNEYIDNLLDRSNRSWQYNRSVEKTFIGKSTVMKEDEFDQIKGERIAEAKAKLKAFKWLERALKTMDMELINKRYALIDMGDKSKELIKREEKHLSKLVK